MATSPAKSGMPNEDFAAGTANGAVLLDGAGLSGTTSKCIHGVAWYTRHLGGALVAGLPNEDHDLVTVLADAIRDTALLHADTCDLNDAGTPSATVVMIRRIADQLQYLVLADSVLVIEEVDAPPTVITDDREAQVGKPYRKHMDATTNGTPEHDDARRRYVETLRDHRNRPGGFWVAAADPSAAHEAITGSRSLSKIKSALLLSDGASRLADRFALANWSQVLALVETHGPDEIIRRVRLAEDADPYGTRWPRGKAHDDATLLYCTGLQPNQDRSA